MSQRVPMVLLGLVCFLLGCLVMPQLPWLHAQQVQPKSPKWEYGIEMQVRKAGETDFTKDTKKIGVEVYVDENTKNLIYVSETGSIAVIPAK